jgi:hypothetical protein
MIKSDVFFGFCAGVVFKNTLCDVLSKSFLYALSFKKNKKRNQINKKVILIAKIINQELFDEYFPELNTKFRTQPQWEYNPSKNIIKIELEEPITEGICSLYLHSTDIDISFFETFCELFVYVYYVYDQKEYINVYQPNEVICKSDFIVSETELFKKYRSLICATFECEGKQVYITKYFKMFLNNKSTITPEMLVMYNDYIKTFNGSFRIFNNNEIIKNFI